MIRHGRRHARVQDPAIIEWQPSDGAAVDARRVQRFDERRAVRQGSDPARSAGAILIDDARGHEQRPPRSVVEEEPRPERVPLIAREIRPGIVVQILAPLMIGTGGQRVSPVRRQRSRRKSLDVCSVARRAAEEQFRIAARRH